MKQTQKRDPLSGVSLTYGGVSFQADFLTTCGVPSPDQRMTIATFACFDAWRIVAEMRAFSVFAFANFRSTFMPVSLHACPFLSWVNALTNSGETFDLRPRGTNSISLSSMNSNMVCLSCNFTVRRDCLTTTNLIGFGLERATHKVIKALWNKGLVNSLVIYLSFDNLHTLILKTYTGALIKTCCVNLH